MSPTARSPFPSGSYSRAVVGVSAEEHGLAAVVAEPVLLGALDVAALGVRRAHARLKVLYGGQTKRWSEIMERWDDQSCAKILHNTAIQAIPILAPASFTPCLAVTAMSLWLSRYLKQFLRPILRT